MRYTEIAGRRVSAMSLGTVQLGMNYGIANNEGKPDREKSFSILSAARSAGITTLDTARAYGDSEEVLGAYFRANPRIADDMFITTKLSSGLPSGAPSIDVEKALTKSVETSLTNLGLCKVNCLLLHNAADMTLHGNVTASFLKKTIAQGLADIAGVSVYHPEEIDEMLKDDIYRAVQLPSNIFDQRFIKSGALDRLNQRGVKIFVRSVFFQGLLFLDPETISDPDLIRCAVPHLKTLRSLSEKAGMSVGQFAAAFLMNIPGIASLVLGADNPEQVIENRALFEAGPLNNSIANQAKEAFGNVDYKGIMAVLSRPKVQDRG